MSNELRNAIIATSQSLGINPLDLATAISYETAGTFDPVKRGPTTQWGQHRGLIQFGEPQAEKYGVDWNNPVGSQLGENGAVAKYLRDAGVKPGMGLLDIYSAINAGHVGKYNASDANNGGAPGTVRDKVNDQMSGHRSKAAALLGGDFSAPQPQQQSAPVLGSMAPSSPAPAATPSPVPGAVSIASGQQSTPADIFGMMAMGGQQSPQFSPVQIMGPSPDQANALSSLVAALKNRII
jgi:hypothetical protein